MGIRNYVLKPKLREYNIPSMQINKAYFILNLQIMKLINTCGINVMICFFLMNNDIFPFSIKYKINEMIISSSSSSVFCPKAGPSLQAEKPRLQFCRRQVFHRKLSNQGSSFTRDLIGTVASRCFPHPTLSLASEQTLKDLRRSQGYQRGGEEIGIG